LARRRLISSIACAILAAHLLLLVLAAVHLDRFAHAGWALLFGSTGVVNQH